MSRRFIILYVLSFIACSCARKEFVVNIISDAVVAAEIGSLVPGDCEVILSDSVDQSDLNTCNLLWIHGVTDSSAFDGDAIVEYVKRGGNLILTSGAVLQLNHWGLESESISKWQYSDMEFAHLPFYSHPIFANLPFDEQLSLFSGEDFSVFGFCGSARPQMKDAAVVSVAYEDGICIPERKIMWEAPLIHGKVLAVGTDLPLAKGRRDRRCMKRLVSNMVSYLLDARGESEDDIYAGTWNEDTLRVQYVHAGHHIDCKICAAEYKPVKPRRPETIDIPKGKRRHVAENDVIIELSEGQISIKVDENAGIAEVWMDGMMAVKDYRPLVDIADVDTIIDFSAYVPYLEMHERGFTRYYTIGDVELSESVVLYPEHSSVVIHYQWTDSRVRQMFTEHKTNLSFGYPYDGTMMSLYHVWSLQLNATVVRSHDRQFSSIVGSNVPGRSTLCGKYGDISYTDWRVRGTHTDALQVASSVVYGVKGLNSMDVVISGTVRGTELLSMDYAYTLKTPGEALEIGLKL